ncbi:MAG: HWE histidine kinase domain-containing protein [Acetobacterales bacterium]
MSRFLWIAAFALFTLVCLGFWGAAVREDREQALVEVESRAATLAQLLERHAEHALDSGDTLVTSLAAQGANWDMRDPASGEHLHQRMAEAVQASPHIDAVWVLDASGTQALNSRHWPAKPENFDYRSYFQIHRDGFEGLLIGQPGVGAISLSDRFTMSRPIRRGDGSFRGVAVAGLQSEYFRRFYEEARTPEGTRIRLFLSDGTLLTSWPPETDTAATLPAPAHDVVNGRTITVREDGRVRALRRLDGFPVFVAANLPIGPALEAWRSRAMFDTVPLIAAILGFALLMAFGLRGVRRLEEANQGLEFRIDDRTAALGLSEALARDSERELKLVADAMPALIAFIGQNERYRFVNSAYARWVGKDRALIEGSLVRDVLPPQNYEQVAPHMREVLRGRQVRADIPLLDAAGHERELDAQYIPRMETDGRVSGFYVFAADVTERKEASRRQSLLMAELDHRVRNILATIQSMVSLTEAATDSKASFGEALRGRVGAMARTHGLLTAHRWSGADVAEIVRDELSAYAPDERAYTIRCDRRCMLPPKLALDLALAVHELATNAAKYGALKVPGGHVTVRCVLEAAPDGLVADILWQETGGPPVEGVGKPGFGSRLITGALGSHANAVVELDFPREGAVCHIRLQLPASAATKDAPALSRAAPLPSSRRRTVEELRNLRGLRVLVAEDERLVAMDLERQLAQWGITVLGPADSLSEAVRIAGRTPPDLALLDLNLGGESSEPLARDLLRRQVPVLFLTGYHTGSILPGDLKEVPALQKPVDRAELHRHLSRLSAQAGRRTPAG